PLGLLLRSPPGDANPRSVGTAGRHRIQHRNIRRKGQQPGPLGGKWRQCSSESDPCAEAKRLAITALFSLRRGGVEDRMVPSQKRPSRLAVKVENNHFILSSA